MLVVMNSNATEEQIYEVTSMVKALGFEVHLSKGKTNTIIGIVGEKTSSLDPRKFELLEGVNEVIKISSPYKLASRQFKEEDSVIEVRPGISIGAEEIIVFAGPCAVENKEVLEKTAREVHAAGAKVLRGGAFKPRTSPYDFQGLGEEALIYLRNIADELGMAVCSEIMESNQIPLFLKYVDILQVGARNMQNFNLLRDLSVIDKPVLIKRGMSATIKEWLMSAEYVLAGGNNKVILCERGIRTFETATRNTLDISAIPMIKTMSHLPIIVDPSHAVGIRDKVIPVARAAVAAGADGLIIEVNAEPEKALCDGAQSLYPKQFKQLMKELAIISPAVGRSIDFMCRL